MGFVFEVNPSFVYPNKRWRRRCLRDPKPTYKKSISCHTVTDGSSSAPGSVPVPQQVNEAKDRASLPSASEVQLTEKARITKPTKETIHTVGDWIACGLASFTMKMVRGRIWSSKYPGEGDDAGGNRVPPLRR